MVKYVSNGFEGSEITVQRSGDPSSRAGQHYTNDTKNIRTQI